MKLYKSLFFVITFAVFTVIMIALSSCEETIYKEIIKLDTVFVNAPRSLATSVIVQYDTVVIRDTIRVETIVHDTLIRNVHTTDTLIHVLTKDSIIIKEVEKLVTIYDTIYQVVNNYDTIVEYVTDTVEIEVIRIEQRILFKDTLYILDNDHTFTWVPEELFPFVQEFMRLAGEYGKSPYGMPLVIEYVNQEDLPGEGYNSYSFRIMDQYVIRVNANIETKYLMTPIFRELAVLELGKKYTLDTNQILSPWFNPYRLTMDSPDKEPYLDVLFQ